MVTQATKTGALTLQPLMQIELFLASLVPTTGILLVTAIGTRWIRPEFLMPFLALALVGAIAVFLAEFALISLMQRVIREQFSDLVVVCQTYLAGNKQVRAVMQGNSELTTTLATALNALLDFVSAQEKQYVVQKAAYETYEEPFKRGVKQFVAVVAPWLDAQLRMQVEKAAENPGTIIDICGYVVQECRQSIHTGRATAQQIVTTTRGVISNSIDLAQNSETLMLDFARTSERVEKLVAFMQRLGSMLQSYIDDAQEATPLSPFPAENGSPLEEEAPSEPAPVEDDATPRDERTASDPAPFPAWQLLEETVHTLQEQTIQAEAVVEEFYTFAQGMHQANTDVLQMVEQISSLVGLAEQWRNSPSIFHFSENESHSSPFLNA